MCKRAEVAQREQYCLALAICQFVAVPVINMRDSKLIFSFSLTTLEVVVDGKIFFLPGGRWASEV